MNSNLNELNILIDKHFNYRSRIPFRKCKPIELREIFSVMQKSFKTSNGNWSTRLFKEFEDQNIRWWARYMMKSFEREYAHRIKSIKGFEKFVTKINEVHDYDLNYRYGFENHKPIKLKKDEDFLDFIADFKKLKKYLKTTDKELSYAIHFVFKTEKKLSTIEQYLSKMA
ncbi:hypothetical protein ACOKFD_16315 [Flagellimonas sp. S174]|uniref:hypothetical protein n=1 Tax=Flagellimonas sp. S174 TaxID=3410790 RepID=UPI003BF517FC